MGAPELPNDEGEQQRNIQAIDIIGQGGPVMVHSDESDNDSEADAATYMGYQPLPTNMEEARDVDNSLMRSVNGMEDEDAIRDGVEEDSAATEEKPDPNLPSIETADREITREIWNEPRPQELQLELDTESTQQILNAMANINLPNVTVPDWASGVPEDLWKEELLRRIRQRQQCQPPGKSRNKKEE